MITLFEKNFDKIHSLLGDFIHALTDDVIDFHEIVSKISI